MKQYFFTCATALCCFTAVAQQTAPAFPSGESNRAASFSYRIIPAAHNTFAYEILRDNKVFIRQESKPGLPGLDGFRDKAAAERVAGLVIKKLRQGEMPPTVTVAEMKALDAL